jgi:hypothetical protein
VVLLLGNGMIVFVKQKLHGAFIAGVVRNKQVGGISYEKASWIKGTLALKHPNPILPKPSHQGLAFGVLGDLAQIIRVTGGLPVIVILLVKPLTEVVGGNEKDTRISRGGSLAESVK